MPSIPPQTFTVINASTVESSSQLIPLAGVRLVTMTYIRANDEGGGSGLKVYAYVNGTVNKQFMKLMEGLENTIAQGVTRTGEVIFDVVNGTKIVTMDLENDAFYGMVVTTVPNTGDDTVIVTLHYF